MAELKELPIPPSSLASERAVEILRIWINADKSMDATLIPTFYETGYWGGIIIDLMHRLGEAYEAEGLKKEEVVESIYAVVVDNFDSRSKLRAEQLAKAGSTMKPAPTPPKRK